MSRGGAASGRRANVSPRERTSGRTRHIRCFGRCRRHASGLAHAVLALDRRTAVHAMRNERVVGGVAICWSAPSRHQTGTESTKP